MTTFVENIFYPLSFIAGPAILTNACAVMQNSASLRYSLAIQQWREFHSLSPQGRSLAQQYADPAQVLKTAEKRIRCILLGLSFLYIAVALFGTTCILALAGSFSVGGESIGAAVTYLLVITAAAGLLSLFAATTAFLLETAAARALLRLHNPLSVVASPQEC